MLAFDAALNAVWAMEERALEQMLDILARDNLPTPEALEAYRAKSLANADRARVRNGVAVLDAIGPLTKRGNLFTAMSGATSYEILRADLATSLDDPKVKAILLNVDSPGGEASGTGELAQAIFEARGRKPIVAYVGGTGASAAYWIASAADRVVVDPSAILGSIGVQVAASVREPKAGEKHYRFVSTQSPDKNAEIGTEVGDKQIQEMIDAMAAVFVGAVARNRGVATETVLSDFGKGGTFVGQMAVKAGLADSVGTFEGVLAELAAPRRKTGNGAKMTDETTFTAAERDAAVASARAAEKSRVANLRAIATGFGASEADLTAAIDGDLTVEAFSLAQAEVASAARATEAAKPQAQREVVISALKADEDVASAAAASAGDEPEAQDTAEVIAARITAA